MKKKIEYYGNAFCRKRFFAVVVVIIAIVAINKRFSRANCIIYIEKKK